MFLFWFWPFSQFSFKNFSKGLFLQLSNIHSIRSIFWLSSNFVHDAFGCPLSILFKKIRQQSSSLLFYLPELELKLAFLWLTSEPTIFVLVNGVNDLCIFDSDSKQPLSKIWFNFFEAYRINATISTSRWYW